MMVSLREAWLRVKPGVVTGLCADPLLHHEGRSCHVVHAVLDVGLVGSGLSDDADHRHLREEDNRETKDPKTPSRTNKPLQF